MDAIDIPKSNQVINQYHYPLKTVVYENAYSQDIVVGRKGGKTMFQFGKYRNYTEADSMVFVLNELGCADVGVNAYLDGAKISIQEAITSQYGIEIDAYSKHNKRSAQSVYLVEVNYLVDVQRSRLDHYYSVAVVIDNPEKVNLIYDNFENAKVAIINNDKKIYAVGKYDTFDEVVEARKKLIKADVNEVFIMAQFFDKRLSNEDNQGLEYAIKPVVAFIASQ